MAVNDELGALGSGGLRRKREEWEGGGRAGVAFTLLILAARGAHSLLEMVSSYVYTTLRYYEYPSIRLTAQA